MATIKSKVTKMLFAGETVTWEQIMNMGSTLPRKVVSRIRAAHPEHKIEFCEIQIGDWIHKAYRLVK